MALHNILLVDNELLSRELLTNHLKHNDFAVQVAADSQEAVKIISRNRFPLAIISSGIGEKPVSELIARIRAKQKDSLVYLLVSQAGAYDADKLEKIGVYDTIIKPFRLEDVKLKLRHALELLTLKDNTRKLSEKLQRLQNQLKRYETVENYVKIPDLSSIELPEYELGQESQTVGANLGQPAQIPVQPGEKSYRKQQQSIESGNNTIEQIRQLDKLRKAGILTEQEFKNKKKELLKRI